MQQYQLEQQQTRSVLTDLPASSEFNPNNNDAVIAWIDRIDLSLDTIFFELQTVREELRSLRHHILNK